MSTLVPTDDERKKLEEILQVVCDIPLGAAEQCLAVMSSIPDLSERLKLWAFKIDYETSESASFVLVSF